MKTKMYAPMNDVVNPEMLTLARESRGLTQNDLARETQVSQANISRYESGLTSVADEHLDTISRFLNYQKRFFYLKEEKHGFGTSCTYHRRKQSISVQELKTLLAVVNVWRIKITPLLRGAEIECNHEMIRFDRDPDCQVDDIASRVRAEWLMPFGPVKSVTRTIENAGGIVLRIPFGTKKLDAISQWVPGLPPMFFVNDSIPGDRARFTLAHELGHIVMHRLPSDDPEGEADAFAAEFLMPAQEIGPQLTSISFPRLMELKAEWRVSLAALIKRAYDLEKITTRQYRAFFEQLSRSGFRVNEPIPIPFEEPTVLNEVLEIHRKHYGYSLDELSQLTYSEEVEMCEQFHIERPHGALRLIG